MNMPTKLKQTKLFDLVIEACPDGKGTGKDISSYTTFSSVIKDYTLTTPARYWAILHYADFNEKGEIERLHWHLVLDYWTRKTFTGVIRDLADAFVISDNRITCEPARSKIRAIRYLMHLDDPDKMLYAPYDVITNDPDKLIEAISRPMDELTIQDVIEAVDGSKSVTELITRIGIKNYQRFRSAINDVLKERRWNN